MTETTTAGRPGRSGWPCRWPGRWSWTWPSSTARASARCSCAAPTSTPAQVDQVLVPCGHTLASVCPSCAERARSLRAAQCREGWHLEDEPDITPDPATEDQQWWVVLRAEAQQQRDHAAAAGQDTTDFDALITELDEEIAQAGIRGKVNPGPPGAAAPLDPAPPGCPGPAPPQGHPPDGGQDLHRAGRQDVPAVDVRHPDLPVSYGRVDRGRRTRRPGRLRLRPGRPGRADLRRAVRPVHPEPAPLPRLRRAVLRRRRTPAAARPACPHRDARHRVPRRAAPGARRDLPPGLVARHLGGQVRRGRAAGLGRGDRQLPGPGHRGSAADLGPGPRRHRPETTSRGMWPGSGTGSTPRACCPDPRTPGGASAT